MIAPALITEWSQQCPWSSPAQVEQDLVLSRGLVEIYSDPILQERLLFRGGTALHKIILQPAARYSEDLDFVQLREEPIGSTLDLIRERLNPWLGEAKSDIGPRGATLTYRFESELPPVIRLRLKIEINTRRGRHLHPLHASRRSPGFIGGVYPQSRRQDETRRLPLRHPATAPPRCGLQPVQSACVAHK